MISARKGFYIVWIVLALNLHYGWVKGISGLLETDLFNLGAGYTITVWHFYTYFVMVYTGWFIGHNLQRSAEIVARSNVTAIFAAAVVLLGIIALVDIAVAYITGSGELFLLQLLFNTVCDPSYPRTSHRQPDPLHQRDAHSHSGGGDQWVR